jgi:hypothetical protein
MGTAIVNLIIVLAPIWIFGIAVMFEEIFK